MRVLDWGGAKLEAAISRELGLTVAEAAELKLELDLGAEASEDDDPRVARARGAVARELQTLARELIASLQFYQGQPGSLAISEVLITGGTTKLPGLAEELERLDARSGAGRRSPRRGSGLERDRRARRPRVARRRDRTGGGALMEAVNLLPAYARPGHPWAAVGKDLLHVASPPPPAVAACVIALGLGLGYLHERSVVNDRRATLAEVQAQVAVADAKAAPLRAAQAAAAARMAAAGTVSANRVVWERLLADLSRVLPSQVYLQSLSLQSPTPLASGATTTAPTAGPTVGASGFSATGVASSHVRVALVLDRLARLPWLSNVTLVSSTSGSGGAAPDHERNPVQRRHLLGDRRLRPERRCEMIDRINGRLALLLAIAGLLILLLAGWFVLVSPQRSKAAALNTQIGDASVKLASTQAFLRSPAAHQSVADLRRLGVALPDDVKMSEILRQLAWASRVSGVSITSITPSAPVPSTGAQALPIALTVTGHYFRIAKFMHLLRTRPR